MEQLPKNLLSFITAFISSHTSDQLESKALIRKMLSLKPVQSLLIKTMYILEPLINDELFHIKHPKSTLSRSDPMRQTRLLLLSNSINTQIDNFLKIQEKLTTVLDIVETIDFSVEAVSPEPNTEMPQRELVTFLSGIASKEKCSNYEFEEISDDIWTKHLEVEKMLQGEMEKYYLNLESVENKHWERVCGVKLKTGIKIQKLEKEMKRTWEDFRLQVDRASMQFEDMLSQETEVVMSEQRVLDENNSPEMQVKDYNTAVAKIKSLFMVRKILEKRKMQDERLFSGLNSKISILNKRISELVNSNLKLIENCTSLSWCLEFIFSKSEMPESVRNKAIRLLDKQKCAKLEAMFKIDQILEKYSVESVSKKFEVLKEGLANVSNALKDENAKIKISRLINESRLDEVDKTEVLKGIQPAMPAGVKVKGKGGNKKETVKDLPKRESALEKMRKEMRSIEEEIQETDKQVEEMIFESHRLSNTSLTELVQKSKSKNISGKSIPRSNLSPKSQKTNLKTEGSSFVYEEVPKESKSTQIFIQTKASETQTDTSILKKVSELLQTTPKPKKPEKIPDNELEIFILEACRHKLKQKTDKFQQTNPEPGVLEFGSPSSTLIRGIMKKFPKPSSKVLKLKEPLDAVSESLVITKLLKKEETVFKTEIADSGEDFKDISYKLNKPDQSSNTPIPNLTSFLSNYSKITSAKLINLAQTAARRLSRLEIASEQYKKEFALQTQLKGLKKMTFEDIQAIWEEVINRRIVDGEKDKISVYLRGYLGTDKFELEKAKIISLMQSDNDLSPHISSGKVISESILAKWKQIMQKILEKKSFSFKEQVSQSDSPREVLFKAAKSLKFVKHRLGSRERSEVMKKKPEPLISYSTDKWALNSTSVSPMESLGRSSKRILKKTRHYPRLMAKTPIREKFISSELSKLPFL